MIDIPIRGTKKTKSTHISSDLGDDLRKRARKFPQVNWSEVIRRHIEAVVQQLEKESVQP